jgi:hypothetical protein
VEPGWPPDVERLFWDVEPQAVDVKMHADYIMDRVMSRGTLAAMHWLRATYSREALADFLKRKGDRLAPRDRAYWRLIAGLAADDRPGGGTPPWMQT